MTARHLMLSIVLVASQLAACGGASIATPESLDCNCDETATATTARAPATAAASTTTVAAPAATAPASAPITTTLAARSSTTRSPRASTNADTRAVDALRVHRMVLARGVSNRAPVEPGDHFVVGPEERLYTWVEVENAGDDASELVFTWIPPQGAARGGQALEVPSARRWRTWAFTRQARTPGEWTAEVRTTDGQLLARQTFTVEAPEPTSNAVPRS